MAKRLMVAMMAATALLGGCARKAPPNAASYAPGPGAPVVDDRAALQADLASTAGDHVFFALDSYVLTATGRDTLARQAEWLRSHSTIGFSIEGHCDERGTRDYNLALGARRAKAAADYLIGQGVSPQRITTISYGKERPEALGSDEQSYARNRRAVSIVLRP